MARTKVRAGELTERSLARLCGVSQPHMHNVLKGIRALSTDSADRLLEAMKLTVPELIWQRSGVDTGGVKAVPILRNRIGPGTNASLNQLCGFAPFPAALTNYLIVPVLARIAPDLVLPKGLAADDLALLDQNQALREHPPPNTYWVVNDGNGLRIRYVRLAGSRIWIANESNVANQSAWRCYSLRDRSVLDFVQARVVWIGRELTTPYGSV